MFFFFFFVLTIFYLERQNKVINNFTSNENVKKLKQPYLKSVIFLMRRFNSTWYKNWRCARVAAL